MTPLALLVPTITLPIPRRSLARRSSSHLPHIRSRRLASLSLALSPATSHGHRCAPAAESDLCGGIPITSCSARLAGTVAPGLSSRLEPTYIPIFRRFRDRPVVLERPRDRLSCPRHTRFSARQCVLCSAQPRRACRRVSVACAATGPARVSGMPEAGHPKVSLAARTIVGLVGRVGCARLTLIWGWCGLFDVVRDFELVVEDLVGVGMLILTTFFF